MFDQRRDFIKQGFVLQPLQLALICSRIKLLADFLAAHGETRHYLAFARQGLRVVVCMRNPDLTAAHETVSTGYVAAAQP